ncbi:MAG: SPOR domain-containing protein [Rickettsiales bacterium]|nr:SPOR domain-containing protein [Rickettsiales bacterium]
MEKTNVKSIGDIYRLQIGDFGDDSEALAFCNEYIKSRKENVSCILVRK